MARAQPRPCPCNLRSTPAIIWYFFLCAALGIFCVGVALFIPQQLVHDNWTETICHIVDASVYTDSCCPQCAKQPDSNNEGNNCGSVCIEREDRTCECSGEKFTCYNCEISGFYEPTPGVVIQGVTRYPEDDTGTLSKDPSLAQDFCAQFVPLKNSTVPCYYNPKRHFIMNNPDIKLTNEVTQPALILFVFGCAFLAVVLIVPVIYYGIKQMRLHSGADAELRERTLPSPRGRSGSANNGSKKPGDGKKKSSPSKKGSRGTRRSKRAMGSQHQAIESDSSAELSQSSEDGSDPRGARRVSQNGGGGGKKGGKDSADKEVSGSSSSSSYRVGAPSRDTPHAASSPQGPTRPTPVEATSAASKTAAAAAHTISSAGATVGTSNGASGRTSVRVARSGTATTTTAAGGVVANGQGSLRTVTPVRHAEIIVREGSPEDKDVQWPTTGSSSGEAELKQKLRRDSGAAKKAAAKRKGTKQDEDSRVKEKRKGKSKEQSKDEGEMDHLSISLGKLATTDSVSSTYSRM